MDALATAISDVPLAVMPVDAAEDGVADLVVSASGFSGKFYDAEESGAFVPRFIEATQSRFGSNPPQSSTTSCVSADYDGDGHEDFLAAHLTGTRLYRWNPDLQDPRYEFMPDSVITDLPDTVYAAAWGDYDRDGWLDLAVAGREVTDNIFVFRNAGQTGGPVQLHLTQWLPVDLTGASSSASAPYSIVWADLVPGDGELELIVGTQDAGQSTLKVYAREETFNKAAGDYQFADHTDIVFPLATGGAPIEVVKPVLADLDGDGDQDLVVACDGAADNLRFYVNTAGVFAPVTTSAWSIGSIDEHLAGVLVADMDPDGAPDLTTVPAGAASPRLLLNSSATGMEFTEIPTTLPAGAAAGGLAYDWQGGRPNLYLAKGPAATEVEEFFYGYEPAEGVSLGQSVRVRVGATDIMNTSGIGTRVEVEWDGKHAYQWISGGEGRFGQQPRDLVFGLGEVEGAMVIVRALWPDGVVTEVPRYQSVADTVTISRSSPIVIDETTIWSGVLMDTNYDVWFKFEWSSDRAGVPEVVFYRNTSLNPIECDCALPESEVITLTHDMPDVSISGYQTDDGVFHHALVWTGRCCVTNCNYEYQVQNRLINVVATSTKKLFKTPKFCTGTP